MEIFLTSYLSNKNLLESDPDAATLLASTSATLIASTFIDEEERERLFHTKIWVQKNPLHLIVDNGLEELHFEVLMKKLGLVTT